VEFNLQNADESEVIYAKKLKSGEVNFAAIEDALTQFVELANAHGFKPVVAYSPSAYTAYADYVEFDDPVLNTLMPWFSQAQRQFLSETADKLGYTFVDLAPAMQAAARVLREKEMLYHPINVHFTMKGNRIVAETLAKVILAQQAGASD
jgi:lysophospholipase L1-like esterase